MRFLGFIVGILLMQSCLQRSSMEKPSNTIFLHDNSSKVWLVDKKMEGNRDYTPVLLQYKELLVFHQNGHAYFYKLQDFGKRPGLKMDYSINSENREFELYNPKRNFKFKIKTLSRTRLVLKSTKRDYPYTLVLIPFPEY